MTSFKKKYIITGPPGAGKTTLIEALRNKDYSVMPEVSRDVILRQHELGGDGCPWKDVVTYASLVYHKTQERLEKYSNALFVDRSLVDTMAYLEFYNKNQTKELKEFSYHKHYNTIVFFAPSWGEIYKTDSERPQQFKELNGLGELLWDTYQSLGFTCVLLPKKDVATRVKFVLNKIEV